MPNNTKASTYDTLIDGLMEQFGKLSGIETFDNINRAERVVNSMCKIAETVSEIRKDRALYGDDEK